MTMGGTRPGAYKRPVDTSLPARTESGPGFGAAAEPAVQSSPAEVRNPPARTARDRSEGGPFRVVVADDADSLRELLCLLLDTEPDFTVVGLATNGAEAVDVVARTAPDLVLLDVAMPVLDGLGALPRVRTAVPDARVVIFTGFSEATLRDEAMALGADALMEKGLATGQLVDQLRHVCRQPRSA